MGNICSSSSDHAETTPQPRLGQLPKITPEWASNGQSIIGGKSISDQPASSTSDFKIFVDDGREASSVNPTDAQLPAYSPRPPSTIKMLNTWKYANELQMFGFKGAFNIMRQRHFHVWIDSNYTLPRDTMTAIRLVALNLLQVAKAIDCDLTIFFTGYPNKKSSQLSYKDKARLQALRELWVTQSWQEAKQLVHRIKKLQELGIQAWIDDETNFDKEESGGERHTRLLIHVRQKMLRYWHGYHQRELTAETLVKAHNSAISAARKQPKSLNSIRFTYEREIKHYQRLMLRDEAYPLTTLLLLASAMQPTEIDAIQQCQKVGADIKRQTRGLFVRDQKAKGDIEGRGTQFCIESVVMTGNLDTTAIKGYEQIDNFASGEDDINDITTLNESRVLKKFLSPRCFLKILNSHHPSVDNMTLPDADKYSSDPFPDQNLTIPNVLEVKKALGIEDDLDLEYESDEEVGFQAPSGVNIATAAGNATNNNRPDSSTFGFNADSNSFHYKRDTDGESDFWDK